MVRLKTELEEANLDQALLTMYYVGLQFKEQCIVQEGVLGAMRAKHNNTMAELGTQIDELNKSKCKTERDKVTRFCSSLQYCSVLNYTGRP